MDVFPAARRYVSLLAGSILSYGLRDNDNPQEVKTLIVSTMLKELIAFLIESYLL
jgi:hypothetical protein